MSERLGQEVAQRVVENSGRSMKTPHKPPYSLLAYLRAIGGTGTALGIAGMFLTAYFWWAATFLNIGLLILLADLYFESQLRIFKKATLAAPMLIGLIGFNIGIIAFKAPVNVNSAWDNGNNFAGSEADGIRWTSDMSRLVVFVQNPTDRDYIDFDFSIFTSEGIAAIKQTSFVPCERLSEQQTSISGNFAPLLEVAPQRFRCDKLPRHTTMKFVAALLNADEMKRGMAGHFPTPGTQYPHGLFWPKRKPQSLAISATYTVNYRPYTRAFSVAVGG